jgi:putative transposase
MTPAMVHFGQAPAIDTQRRHVLHAAYAAHPERFKGRVPMPPAVPALVGINLTPLQPKPTETAHDLTTTPALRTNFSTEVSQSH